MGDITANFSYREFRPKSASRSWTPESEFQKLLIDKLAENLQIIRDELPSSCSLIVTSGVRTLNDYHRLKNKGYHPSKTSDHYCGTSIQLSKNGRKYAKFGDTYNFAVGAADIVPVGLSVKDLFNLSVNLTEQGSCSFGQIIYERNPDSGSEWIHYGNFIKGLYCDEIVDLINRLPFLKSLDGGRSYEIAKSVK